MVPKGGLEPPRVTSHAPQTCASTSSATSARQEGCQRIQSGPGFYFFAGVAEIVSVVDIGLGLGETDGDGDGDGWAVGEADGSGPCSGTPDCKTELVPVTAGSESVKASSMKAAAAPIVIFASRVWVPRGPNAVLDTELENSAPASAFPGCKRMVTTRMTHARINNPYKV